MYSISIKNAYIIYQNLLLVLFFTGGIFKAILNGYIVDFNLTLFAFFLVLLDSVFMILLRLNRLKFNALEIFPSMLLALFYFLIIFSLFYTFSESYAYSKASFFLINLLCFFYPFLMLKFKLSFFKKVIKYVIVPISIWFIYARYQYWLPSSEHIRLAKEGFFKINGLYLILGSIIGLYIIALFYEKKKPWLLISILSIILFALGSRGALIFTALTLVIFNIKTIVRRIINFKFKKKFLYLIISFLLFFPFLAYRYSAQLSSFFVYGIYRFTSLFNIDKDSSSQGRLERMSFAFDSIFDSVGSFFFGHGIGSFGILYLGEDTREYPHNIFLETFFELGLIGTIVISLFIFFPFFVKGNTLLKAFYLFVLFDSLKSGNLTDLWVLFCVSGLVIFTQKKAIDNDITV